MPLLFTGSINLTSTADTYANTSDTDAHNYHPGWLRIFRTVIMSLLVILTLFGNSLLLAGLRKIEEMRSVTGIFLANLAISDLGVGLVCLPIAIAATADETILEGRLICNMDGFSLVLFFIGSIQTLCAISVHKYIAIVYAMKITVTRKRAYLMITGIWGISLLLAVGPLFGWSKYVYKLGRHQCAPPIPEDIASLSHMTMLLGFGYVMPLLTMVLCYSRIYCTTKAHLKRLKTNAIVDSISTTESELINTLVLVLLCFIFCWLPFVVYISYGMTKQPIPYYLPTIAFLFGYGNSALNPVIYALRHKSFRKGFRTILCKMMRSNKTLLQDNTLTIVVSKNSPVAPMKQTVVTRTKNAALMVEPLISEAGLRIKTDGAERNWKVDQC